MRRLCDLFARHRYVCEILLQTCHVNNEGCANKVQKETTFSSDGSYEVFLAVVYVRKEWECACFLLSLHTSMFDGMYNKI